MSRILDITDLLNLHPFHQSEAHEDFENNKGYEDLHLAEGYTRGRFFMLLLTTDQPSWKYTHALASRVHRRLTAAIKKIIHAMKKVHALDQ